MPYAIGLRPRALPAAFVAPGVPAGLLLQRLIVVRLREAAARSAWKGDDVIVESLGELPLAWCFGAGVYAVTRTFPMAPEHVGFVDEVIVSAAIFSGVASEVMREVPGGVATFQPFIRHRTLGDSGIGFIVVLRAKRLVEQHLPKHGFVKRLHARYAEDGIRTPFPTRTVEILGGVVAER